MRERETGIHIFGWGIELARNTIHGWLLAVQWTWRGEWNQKVWYLKPKVAFRAQCPIPPPGWSCTRTPGHDGPCAAVPDAPTLNP